MPVTFVLATQFQSQAHSDSTECKMSGKHSTYVAMYKHKDGGGMGAGTAAVALATSCSGGGSQDLVTSRCQLHEVNTPSTPFTKCVSSNPYQGRGAAQCMGYSQGSGTQTEKRKTVTSLQRPVSQTGAVRVDNESKSATSPPPDPRWIQRNHGNTRLNSNFGSGREGSREAS